MSETIRYSSIASPLGDVFLALSERGLRRLAWRLPEAEFVAELRADGARVQRDDAGLAHVRQVLAEYFAGERRTLHLPLDLGRETDFQRRVRDVVRSIPWGEVLSYGEVARLAGRPGAARAVGGVMAHNPTPLVIPCHRVVGASGALHGFGGGGRSDRLSEKAFLLEHEGLRLNGPPSRQARVQPTGD